MGFWAQRTGAAAPAPATPQVANSQWWLPQVPPSQAPVQPTPSQPVQQASVPSMEGDQQSHFGDLLNQDNYTTTKAQSNDGDRCPDCGSGNYMRASTSKNSMKQCFDCGYNERFLHSTHGATGIGQKDLPTFSARSQHHGAPAGFPEMGSVIAHV